MRSTFLMATMALLAGCGQTGALYLPDQDVKTPVEIRGPATPATPAEPDKDKKDEKPAPSPEF